MMKLNQRDDTPTLRFSNSEDFSRSICSRSPHLFLYWSTWSSRRKTVTHQHALLTTCYRHNKSVIPWPAASAQVAPASAAPPGRRWVYACKQLVPHPAACASPHSVEPGCGTLVNHGRPRLFRNVASAPAEVWSKDEKHGVKFNLT